MKTIKRAALYGVAVLTVVGGALGAASSASAHTIDAYCDGATAHLGGSLYQEADYSIDGGTTVHFVGGFSQTRDGHTAHSVTVSNSSDNVGNGTKSTPVCVETTTTVKHEEPTTTTQPAATTTVPEETTTQPATTTTQPATTTTVPEETTTVPEATTTTPPNGNECIGIDTRNGFPTTGQGTTRGGTMTDNGAQPCGPGLDCRQAGGTFSYDHAGAGVCERPVEDTAGAETAAAGAVVADEQPPAGTLPSTGANTGWIILIAGVLLAAGVTVVLVARRRPTAAADSVDVA